MSIERVTSVNKTQEIWKAFIFVVIQLLVFIILSYLIKIYQACILCQALSYVFRIQRLKMQFLPSTMAHNLGTKNISP